MIVQRSSFLDPLESTNQGINPSSDDAVLKLHNKERDAMENGRTTKLYYERFISLENSMSRLVIINVCLLIIYYEFDFLNSEKDNPSFTRYQIIVKSVLYLISLCTIFVVPLNIFREITKLELEYYQKNTFKIQLCASRMIGLIVETIILMIQPYPFLNSYVFNTTSAQINVSFKYNYLLTLISISKLYTAFRAVLNRTVYMNPRSNRLSKMYLCKADYHFALKCMFRDYPNKLIMSAFLISIILFSFALRICERTSANDLVLTDQMKRAGQLSNSIWLTIITMTTVGYGEMYPMTSCGRVICIILVIWGIFIVSIMVVVLTNTFQMDQRELKVLSLMKKLEKKEDLREASALLIQHLYRWRHKPMNYSITGNNLLEKISLEQAYQRRRKKLRKDFVRIANQIKNICEEDDVYEQMAREFNCLDDDLKSLNRNQEKMMDYIHEKIENRGTKK